MSVLANVTELEYNSDGFNANWVALPGPNCNVREALNGQKCNRGMES